MSQYATVSIAALALLVACQSAPTPGASCVRTSECAGGGLVCRFGRCRAECEANVDCPIGAACLLGADGIGACGLDTDLGCQTGIGRQCASGLVCVADRCERPCTGARECPTDAQCLPIGDGARFCFDGRVSPDAGLPDVGPGDAWTPPPVDAGSDASILRSGALDVCVGPRSACVIGADRRVYCWGASTFGQLGTGGDCTSPGASVRVPTMPVVGVTNADSLACGDDFACAHSGDGTVSCWGTNAAAQLGRHTTAACDATARPVVALTTTTLGPTLGATRTVQLRAAGRHACVLDVTHASLACWGANAWVFDGTSSATTSETAIDATGPLRAGGFMPELGLASFALGPTNACIATNVGGAVYCWGDDAYGQLGTRVPSAVGQSVPLPTPTVALSVGDTYACALDPIGVVRCWGDARNGRLSQDVGMLVPDLDCGPTASDPCSAMPLQVAATSLRFAGLASAGGTSCGVLDMRGSVGVLLCWGDDTNLQAGVPASGATGGYVSFGDEAGTYPVVAGAFDTADTLAGVAMGASAGCAIDARGSLFCWGDDDLDPATAPTASAVMIQLP